MKELEKLKNLFNLSDLEIKSELHGGLINDTFLATSRDEKLVIQKINQSVFTDLNLLESNYQLFSNEVFSKILAPSFILSKKRNIHEQIDESIFRVSRFIEGRELNSLNEFDVDEFSKVLLSLHQVNVKNNVKCSIDSFHQFEIYLNQLEQIANDEFANEVLNLGKRMLPFYLGLEKSSFIHGDPKLNNVIRNETGLYLIDFDTAFISSPLIDIGDALRSLMSEINGGETEEIQFNETVFNIFKNTYQNKFSEKHLIESLKLISIELCIRFLTDHLSGDKYFKTNFIGENLLRAKSQFSLYRSTEKWGN